MLKTIPINKLRIGSYIESTGVDSFQTELPTNDFFIVDIEQINALEKNGVRQVTVNVKKGLDITRDGFSTTLKSKRFAGFSMEHLLLNKKIPCDLLIKQGGLFVPYLSQGQIFNDSVYNFLKCHYEEKEVFIYESEKPIFLDYKAQCKAEQELSKQGLVAGFETPEKVKQYNDYLNNYYPVDSAIFSPGMKIPFQLFTADGFTVKLLVEAESRIPENEYFSNDSGKKKNILIELCKKEAYKNFVRVTVKTLLSGNEEKDRGIKMAMVKENSKLVTKDLMDNPRSGQAMKDAELTVMDMVENVLENPTSFYGLMKLDSYDYYTYMHSVNVCTLSIGLAVSLGLSKDEIADLALGTLMHDVGKSVVPSTLINKPGKLTEDEFQRIKTHVNLGHEILQNSHSSTSGRAFIPLLQHHEKLNGAGYPNNLEGDQIDIFGRITSIVDVYDALTTERSYKKAFAPFEAVALLKKTPDHYDQEVFKAFVLMLGKQMSQSS